MGGVFLTWQYHLAGSRRRPRQHLSALQFQAVGTALPGHRSSSSGMVWAVVPVVPSGGLATLAHLPGAPALPGLSASTSRP